MLGRRDRERAVFSKLAPRLLAALEGIAETGQRATDADAAAEQAAGERAAAYEDRDAAHQEAATALREGAEATPAPAPPPAPWTTSPPTTSACARSTTN